MDGRVEIFEKEMISLNKGIRKIRVILPIDYHDSNKNYPVIYMHDGQNLVTSSHFSGYSWNIIKTMDETILQNKGFIVVGIDCDEKKRIMEYSPKLRKAEINIVHKIFKLPKPEIKPEAEEYGKFIVDELKPFIDENYRTMPTKDHTFIAGSSCGGVASIYIGLKYQNIFKGIGAFSPAYRFFGESISDYLKNIEIDKDTLIYHDMGTKEAGLASFLLINQMKKFNKLLLNKMPASNINMIQDKKALHNEIFWAVRFKEFIDFAIK